MGTTFDLTAATAVLKQRYTRKKLNTLSYNDNPWLAMIPKDEALGSNAFVFGIRNAVAQTRAWGTFSNSQAAYANAGSSSTYQRFVVPHYNDYTTANISGDAIDSAKGNENALIDVLTAEIDGALYTASRSLAIAMYKNGGGSRGQISSSSVTTSSTITLAVVTDIVNFEVGMPLNSSATDGSGNTGSARSGTAYVIAVDRDLGTITVSNTLGGAATAWSTCITSCAANDYIFAGGDFAGTALDVMVGMGGWLPTTAPTSTDSFYGVNRSGDATRLAGVRYVGAGGPIEETLIEAAARLGREGSTPDYAFLNPLNYSQLVKAIGGKVIYDRAKSVDEPDIGFEAVKLMGPRGPIKVMGDVNCPFGTSFMVKSDTWSLRSIGKAPRIIDLDEVSMLRISNADAYEVRIVSRVCMTCDAPGWNATIQL
jgi:hypothetical protein